MSKKILICLCVVTVEFVATLIHAQESWSESRSQKLRVIVSSQARVFPVGIQDSIVYAFHSISNDMIIAFPTVNYFCFAQLVDSNGVAVALTESGKSFGQKYFELHDFSSGVVRKRNSQSKEFDKKTFTSNALP